jgi:hypothetical protein
MPDTQLHVPFTGARRTTRAGINREELILTFRYRHHLTIPKKIEKKPKIRNGNPSRERGRDPPYLQGMRGQRMRAD